MALKASIARARPTLEALVYAQGWSFPSGHTMGSTVSFGMLAYLALTRFRSHHNLIISLAVLLILFVGASRLYLGVHYLSDVLAGFFAGTAWLVICIVSIEFATRGSRIPR